MIEHELGKILESLKTDPRAPRCSGFAVAIDGSVHVVHRHGCVPFHSIADFLAWAAAKPGEGAGGSEKGGQGERGLTP